MKRRFFTVRKFSRDTEGVAATEFALLMPVMLAMLLGTFEVYFAYTAEDQFSRYTVQVADLMSRENELVTTDITAMLNLANRIMVEVDSENLVELHVASIGFPKTGTPLTLWKRSAGGSSVTFDPADAAGIALPGETVLRVETHFTYTSPFTYFAKTNPNLKKKVVYFKPRETRAIAIDSNVAETNVNWDANI
ncbi:MAG: TadE/TadG family type IV pilus assembly protein [Pseudomonadota bacterium]